MGFGLGVPLGHGFLEVAHLQSQKLECGFTGSVSVGGGGLIFTDSVSPLFVVLQSDLAFDWDLRGV